MGVILSQSPNPETPLPITSIFALVCEPGVCTELQNAANGDWDLERFANPFDWIVELPLTGTSLAFKQLPVSNGLSDETRLKNPTLTPTFDVESPLTTTVDTPLVLPFDIEIFQQDEDVASIFGYTTRGLRSKCLCQQRSTDVCGRACRTISHLVRRRGSRRIHPFCHR